MKMINDNPIFLLEDDPEELNHLKQAIKRAFHLPIIATQSSDMAVQWLSQNFTPCAAYILDIEMKGQRYSGIEVAKRIRQKPEAKFTPIFFITVHSHYGMGALQYIHYYDFIEKPYDLSQLLYSIQSAIQPINYQSMIYPQLIIDGKRCSYELNPDEISCIEQFGTEIVITNLLGQETTLPVKHHAFSQLCEQLSQVKNHCLQQVHRSVIINLMRIHKIDWQKNYATVWLFNVTEGKPISRRYWHYLSKYQNN